ncbi:helix-turn-helix transcriptional regulator [Noviherbaspirillum malthae]|uniref:helix-turn-helix transcriptional regulator n=1 Tax=Noviherbaspirillum malthae TaxID=1260987 RepID=UPI00188EDFB0|nr:AlpA family transcriptional regulator [Noviherbaspirillum malthae]
MAQRSIIRLPEVRARTGLSRSSIYNFIKAGAFPSSIPLGARAIGWDSDAIDAWIDARVAASAKPANQAAK